MNALGTLSRIPVSTESLSVVDATDLQSVLSLSRSAEANYRIPLIVTPYCNGDRSSSLQRSSVAAELGISAQLLSEALQQPTVQCEHCTGLAKEVSISDGIAKLKAQYASGVCVLTIVTDPFSAHAEHTLASILEMFGAEHAIFDGKFVSADDYGGQLTQEIAGVSRGIEVVVVSRALPLTADSEVEFVRTVQKHRGLSCRLWTFPSRRDQGTVVADLRPGMVCSDCSVVYPPAPRGDLCAELLCACESWPCAQCSSTGIRPPWQNLLVAGLRLSEWAQRPLEELASAATEPWRSKLRRLSSTLGRSQFLSAPWAFLSPGQRFRVLLDTIADWPLSEAVFHVCDLSSYLHHSECEDTERVLGVITSANNAVRIATPNGAENSNSARDALSKGVARIEIKGRNSRGELFARIELARPAVVVLSGRSGSGKTRVLNHLMGASGDSRSGVFYEDGQRLNCRSSLSVQSADATERSVAAQTGIFKRVVALMLAQPRSRVLGLQERDFSKSGRFACPRCQSRGVIEESGRDQVEQRSHICGDCAGSGYSAEISAVTYRERTLPQILSSSVEQAEALFEHELQIVKTLQRLRRYGCSHIRLGDSSATLPRGTVRLLALERLFSTLRKSDRCLLLDVPYFGLDSIQAQAITEEFQRQAAQGRSLILADNSPRAGLVADQIYELEETW